MAKSLTIPPLTEDLAQVLVDAATIERRVDEIAGEINRDYKDISEPLILVGVLKGSFIFLADLCRKLRIPHVVDFIAISSYGSGGDRQGNVRMLMDIREDMSGRDVLIVEDILDSGTRWPTSSATSPPAAPRACASRPSSTSQRGTRSTSSSTTWASRSPTSGSSATDSTTKRNTGRFPTSRRCIPSTRREQ